MNGNADALTQVVGQIALTLVWAFTRNLVLLAAAVAAILAAGRIPTVRRIRFLGAFLADAERGARRLFVGPIERALRTGVPPRRLCWILLAAVIITAAVPTLARIPTVLAVTWLVGHSWHERKPGWWSHRILVGALVDAGVLRKPREGERPPNVSYRGRPVHGEHGSSVVIGLPDGRTLSDVLARRESLAASLRVPVARLEVAQQPDDPGNVVRIFVGHGNTATTAATVTSAPHSRWAEPIRIGRTGRGEPVTLSLFEHNTLLAGRPGSGKTSLARIVLSHYLLDPTTAVYALDGKGSVSDYGAARPLCARFVSGTEDNAAEDTLEMMTTVLGIVRTRNGATHGTQHPGLLLLLEEFQDVRAAATRQQRDQLDNMLGRVIRMGRAIGVHVLISTQRPSVDDLPAGVRNLMSQRVALALRNSQDAALVLGSTPQFALPSQRGEAIYTDGGALQPLVLDRLTDDAWRSLCARAAAIRPALPAPVPQEPTATTAEPQQAPEPVSVAPVDPLVAAAVGVLSDADPTGVTASELHARLPEWTRAVCPDARALGVALGRSDGLVERVKRGNDRVWRRLPQTAPLTAPLTARGLPEDSPNGVSPRSNGAALPALPALPPTVPTPHAPAPAPARTPAPERTAP